MAVPRCSSCGKALEEGFLQVQGTSYTTTWVGGPPEKRWGSVNTRKRPRLRVFAMRCINCGLVQLYAPGAPPVI